MMMMYFSWMLDLMLLIIMVFPAFNYKFHPLFFSMMLFLYSILISLKMNYLNESYWYSYMFFLLMVGGVMILIMYLTSISNNEMFMLEIKYYLNYLFKILVLLLIMWFNLKLYNNSFILSDSLDLLNFKNIMMIYEKKFSLYMNFKISLYMISYLFYLMLISVMFCTKNKAPFRQLNK